MKRLLSLVLIAATLFVGCLPASAQNVICTTRPIGDSSNACASTAFVGQNSLSSQMAADTIKCNPTGFTATAQDCTTQQVAGINYPNLVTSVPYFGPWPTGIPGCGNPTWYATGTSAGGTPISNASPAVVSWASHGQEAGMPVYFTTTGVLPAPLAVNTPYYVIAAGLTANAFEISATAGGVAINTTTAGSGSHTSHSNCILAFPMPAGTSTQTIWKATAVSGGGGAAQNKGGGGGGGMATPTWSGIPSGTVMLYIPGAAGFGTNNYAAPRTALNGTSSVIMCRDTVGTCVANLVLADADPGHVSTTNNGGRGGDPIGCTAFIPSGLGPCISQNLQGGSDGSHIELNGTMGGASFWGGAQNVAAGEHGEGGGAGCSDVDEYCFDGFHGSIYVECLYACW